MQPSQRERSYRHPFIGTHGHIQKDDLYNQIISSDRKICNKNTLPRQINAKEGYRVKKCPSAGDR